MPHLQLRNTVLVFVHRDTIQISPAADKDAFVAASQKSFFGDVAVINKADPRSSSPHGKRASPITVKEPRSQGPPKPPRLTPSPTQSISPLLKRRKAEVGRTSPALKSSIPSILVEDEHMETECGMDVNTGETKSRKKEGRVRKREKSRSVQPKSPDEGRTHSATVTVKLI